MEAISMFVQADKALSEGIEKALDTQAISSKHLTLQPGDYLFREGERMPCTYYISRGLIRLFSDDVEGYSKTVFFYRAGSLIGFQAFNDDSDMNSAILCANATTHCEVFAIDTQTFETFLRTHGDLCYEVARYMFQQLVLSTRESVNASIYPVLQRFSALLLALASALNLPQAPAVIPFSNAELANMLGVHPNSVSNSIVALRNAGCVEKQHTSLVIIDFKKLKSVAKNLVVEND